MVQMSEGWAQQWHQKDYKCVNCQGNHGTSSRGFKVWKKERYYLSKTDSKYHQLRSEKDARDYKIRESDKKYPNK